MAFTCWTLFLKSLRFFRAQIFTHLVSAQLQRHGSLKTSLRFLMLTVSTFPYMLHDENAAAPVVASAVTRRQSIQPNNLHH